MSKKIDTETKHVVRLQGGLGNQMFQYAFGQALKHKLNKNVNYDTWGYEEARRAWDHTTTRRTYGLDVYKANPDIASFAQLALMGEACKYVNHIQESVENVYDATRLEEVAAGYYISYWQAEEYFKTIRPQLLEDFTLSKPLPEESQEMLKKIQDCNAVSVHVRRGDYLALTELFCICSPKYYAKAVEYIKEHTENPHFFIFSDDIEWVKENMHVEGEHTIVDTNRHLHESIDLELMRNCKHSIIANSTYSWWGAWLNESPDKIVISPDTWFTDSRKNEAICPEWITLPV